MNSLNDSVKDKAMSPKMAIGVALTLMRLELRRMSFDRNAYQRYGARYPEAVKAHNRSVELYRALTVLERLKDNPNE